MEPIPLPNSGTHARIQKDISLIPIIDNHAHNVLKGYNTPAEYPRETLVSEATGSALNDSVYSLAHMRMVKHLARFLNLPEYASWQEVQAAAKAMDYEVLCRNLVRTAGIQLILFDDGIANDDCHPITWHNRVTPLPNKRIVRIEALFEAIMNKEKETYNLQSFARSMNEYVKDPQVVGFKSIAAYRSGLDIAPGVDLERQNAIVEQIVTQQLSSTGKFRVDRPEVVGWIVNVALRIISGSGKPLQFHTGLGDNDINLVKSDASLLQPLIKAYPDVPFVILHSGYPYARQAGYLATVYSNVYLDFGLAIPLLSGDGQRSMLRQMLELCPTNKLLWSSDAAFHPERFYLAALQTREALSELLAQSIDRHELSYQEGLQIAKRIFFHNSNHLYSLGAEYTQLGPGLIEGSDLGSPEFVTVSIPDAPEQNAPIIKEVDTGPNLVPGYFSRPTHELEKLPKNSLKQAISQIKSRGIQFIRVAWVDYVNLVRYRVIPIEHFESLTGAKFDSSSSSSEQLTESGLSLIRGSIALGVQDSLPSGVSTSKDFTLKPDLSTMWKAPFMPSHAYIMGRFFEKSYAGGEESVICPRNILRRVIQRAEGEYQAKFLVGFETEFILLDQNDHPARTGAWSVSRKLQCGPVANCMHEIAQSIINAGIKLEMYHAESAGGQYEVVTGHLPPLQAADALVATREIIYNVAEKHGLRATLAPRVFSNQGGSACHVHLSVQSPHSDTPSDHPDLPSLPSDLASFMAGLLSHLRTVCAFTLPVDASYDRVVDGAWTGGTWVCWGRENKEAPLRLCGSEGTFNVELKAFDGIANPYLALAAVLAAGSTGLANQQTLEMRNCTTVAAKLTEEQRNEMLITTQMPIESVVFEPDSKERTDYINTWLPSEAWELYKAVRKDERNQISLLEQKSEGHPTMAHAQFFKTHY